MGIIHFHGPGWCRFGEVNHLAKMMSVDHLGFTRPSHVRPKKGCWGSFEQLPLQNLVLTFSLRIRRCSNPPGSSRSIALASDNLGMLKLERLRSSHPPAHWVRPACKCRREHPRLAKDSLEIRRSHHRPCFC